MRMHEIKFLLKISYFLALIGIKNSCLSYFMHIHKGCIYYLDNVILLGFFRSRWFTCTTISVTRASKSGTKENCVVTDRCDYKLCSAKQSFKAFSHRGKVIPKVLVSLVLDSTE